jgi:Flp pilus assembly protein TadD
VLRQPQDPQTLKDLANLLIDTGETRSAVACLRRLTAMRPDDVHAWQNLAVALLLRGQLEDGMAACRRALDIHPGYPPVVFNLGLALAQAGRFNEAARLVASVRAGAPHHADLDLLALRIRVLRWRARLARLFERLLGLR